MVLSRYLRPSLASIFILLLTSVTAGEEASETSLSADISNYVTVDDLRQPTWGDANPELDISDEDYFAFDAKNFDNSLVAVWYSLWTMLRQNDTQWKDLGEWRLFAYDWHNTKNFECALTMTQCSGDQRLEGLQSLYPGIENRPLIRRIYFVSRAYRIFHNYGNLVQTSFERIKTDLVPMTPELVSDFTQQTNQHGERLCSIVSTIGESLISFAVTLTSQALAMALGPLAVEGEDFAQFTQFGVQAGLSAAVGVAQPAVNQALKATAKKAPKQSTGLPGFLQRLSERLQPLQWTSHGVKFSYNWWQTFQSLPFLYYQQFARLMQAARAEYGALEVEGGSGDGGWGKLCSSFEGDFANRNALNMEKLQTWIPGQFEFIRNRIQRLYEEIYEGHVPFHGGPSMMAFMLAGNSWAGNDSFLSDLRDTKKWQYDMERNFVKGVISKLLAKSYNYVTCTHDPKGQSMCDAAEKYSLPSSEWDENMTILSKSRFCPRPGSEPDLVCQVEKWYFAVNNQHSRAMNGLDAFETFQADRFKFRRNELFQESYDNYVRCGNNCTNVDWHKGPFSRDMSFAGIFHLPTCKSDKLYHADFTRYWGWKAHPGKSWNGYENGEWSTWNFPAVCGDHHAAETRGFLEAMNAGIHSDVYSHHYFYRSTDQLWRDRIPRQLEALNLPPYNHFVAMCGAGVYLPGRLFVGEDDGKIPQSPQQGEHYRCKEVAEETAQMDEYTANKWFCVDSAIGKDIQADSPVRQYVLSGLPRRTIRTYRRKCAAWRRDWKLQPAEDSEDRTIANSTEGE